MKREELNIRKMTTRRITRTNNKNRNTKGMVKKEDIGRKWGNLSID